MKKYLVLFAVLIFCFGASYSHADTCQETNSASGKDTDPVTVSIASPFPCTFGGTVTGMTLTTDNTDGGNCPSWYTYTISVTHSGGTETSTDNCNVTDLDLASFNGATIDVSTITDVTVQSVDEDTYSDNVTVDVTLDITYTPVPGQPGQPTNPSPADGATNIPVDGTLTWDWGADTETYDLWFGEAGSMTEVVTGGTAGAEGTQGSYSYSGLSYDTEYEWQLILHNSNRVDLDGPVWSFTTELAPGVIQIGDGTETGQHLPIEPYYAYDYTQTIYASSQFTDVGTDKRIEKLYYNYTKSSSDIFTEDDWVIYMGTTTNTNLDGGWIDVSTLTEVFNGSVGFGALAPGEGWIEIPLNIPFIYDPDTDGNLIIAVDENSDGYTSSSDEFYCTQDARANISRYYYTDDTNPDPSAPPSGTVSGYYPNTRFLFDDLPTTPEFSVTPDSADFGTVWIDEISDSQPFTIINTGSGTLTISSIDITGTDAGQFTLTDTNSVYTLNAGEQLYVDVTFAPTTAGDKSANLTIVDDIARTTHEIPLTGTGFDPYIAAFPYTQNFDNVTEPNLPPDWSKLNDTGDVDAYVETYAEGEYVHSSPNSAKLYNYSESTGNLMLISPPTMLSVTDTRVKFWCRTSSGVQNLIVGTMTDRTDATTFTVVEAVAVDATYAEYTVNITGRGSRTDTYIAFKHGMDGTYDYFYIDDVTWEEIPTTPVFDIVPDSKDFGTVGINETSAAQTFTISNDGVGTLTINSVALTGTDSDQFSLSDTNTYSVDLGKGQSMTVDVAFAPTSEGVKTANLTVIDALSRTQHDIPLTGEGINYNYGGGETDNGGYYFANSTSGAGGAASQPSYDWYPNQTGGTHEGVLIPDTDFGDEDDGYTDFMTIFDDGSEFSFFGINYTQMYLSSNGTIGFGPVPWHDSGFNEIPYDEEEQDLSNMIAWCWQDLEYDSSVSADVNIRISRLSDRTVVTFWHYPEYGGTGEDEYITAQVILYKNGNIKIQYNDSESTYDQDTQNNSIGIENADGTAGVLYRYNGVGGPMFSSPVAIMFGTDEGALPVELTDFRAEVTSQSVKLIWETASEVNNKGFYVYRRQADENYQKISGLIPGSGTTTEPQVYEFVDTNVKYGNLYYYQISDIEDVTHNETFHPSIAVVAGKGIIDPNESFTPHKFALHQNAPNPFNPVTEIKYDLPTPTHVKLTIYDMNGRLVKTLVDREEDAGYYSVTWNGKDNTGNSVGSGVFIYRIETDHETQTRRMVLMK